MTPASDPHAETAIHDIEVKSIGINWFHPPGFLVDRPVGSGDFAFMQWLTTVKIRVDGTTSVMPPGGFIIYRPDDPQLFGSDVFTPFGNHWFHFHGSDAKALVERCGIPLNQPMYLRYDSWVEPLLNQMNREIMRKNRAWRDMVHAYVLRLFAELSRNLGGMSVRLKSARSLENKEVFEEFRYGMKKRCTEPWTLKSMAAEVHLSPSRFGQLYKDFFAVNPVNDLIDMRISLAEYYLCMTNMPIGFVASQCGFSDAYYFSRQFKNRTGETPGSYRLLHGGNEETADAAPSSDGTMP